MTNSKGFWASLTAPVTATGELLTSIELYAQTLTLSAETALIKSTIEQAKEINDLLADYDSAKIEAAIAFKQKAIYGIGKIPSAK